MISERVRSILGVWAPMGIGLFIIATSINFYFTARLSDLESWRLACSAGAFFVGGVMILSTYGRYKKTKEARRKPASQAASVAPPSEPKDGGDGDGDTGREDV